MNLTRRNLIQFAGGSAAGALLTPVPWRLVTDSALWSENWPGVPRPARGEIRTKFTNCALCPAACAVRVKCVGEQPVALAPVKDHPLSHGAMCPWGVAGHHLPYHPARLREGSLGNALAAIHETMGRCREGEKIAFLDLAPGRTASFTYRRAMAELTNGIYIAPRQVDYAIDLEAARTVLSLGVPMMDGWGTPGNVIHARRHFRLIHAEPVETRTAVVADQWLPIAPGSEGELAAALAGEKAASPEIQALAKELRDNGPSVVLAREQMPEVDRLNTMLGAPGRTIVARQDTPAPDAWKKAAAVSDLASVPDGSIRVLLIDESAVVTHIPWSAIERKLLGAGSVVVTFACTRSPYTAHSQFALPAPVYPEVATDMPAAIDATRAAFRITAPLIGPQVAAVNPVDFMSRLAMLDAGDALRERADAIHAAGRGTVFVPGDGKTVALKSMSADEFWQALNGGAAWLDESGRAGRYACPTKTGVSNFMGDGAVVVFAESSGPALNSPLITKLYRESNLRQAVNRVAIGESDAHASGVAQDSRAYLETVLGRAEVRVTIDAAVPAGVIQVADSPAIRDICGSFARGKVVAA